MEKDEFEKSLEEFEKLVRKKLPAMINMAMAAKDNREIQSNFNFFIETLKREKNAINRDIERVARPAQRMRFFNTINTMESLLRAMKGRNSIQERLRQKQHTLHEHITYNSGQGAVDGELLNVFQDGLLLKTSEKLSIDKEIELVLDDGRNMRGKVIWSIPEGDGCVETGVKLDNVSSALDDELHKLIDEKLDT
ncbi:MAG TPA: PilZ domain-containing protein [Desulfomonilia bacterium]